MKRLLTFLLLLLPFTLSAGDSREDYVVKWASTAVSEMYRTGVPASITLAQGLLESGAGRSSLANEGNNHFGIKCHGWEGEKVYFDDDRKGECFRKYKTAAESFADHSNFLRYQKRYQSLFDLPTEDYKGWATGLKAAGYATDPGYAGKLIDLIETYGLSKYDRMSPSDSRLDGIAASRPAASRTSSRTSQENRIPEPPSVLERPQRSTFRFSQTRQVYEVNSVPFVYSMEGETYASIADSYGLFPKEILRFNDLAADCDLLPGTVVFIQHKKNRAVRGLEMHIIESDEEKLRDIAQHYGVRLKSILKMNKLKQEPEKLIPAQMIRLR